MTRKMIIVVATIAIFVSCSNSPENKVKGLIKEAMEKSLYHADTYDPVETQVDSAFSPKDDPAFFELMKDVAELGERIDDLEEKAKRAKSSMAIWSGPYQSAFGRNEYNESKEEYEEATEKIDKLKSKGRKMYEEMVSKLNEKEKFIGFKATHTYRAQNNAGQTVFGNTLFLIDDKFEKILFSCEKEEYDQIQDAIEQLTEEIEEIE